MTEIYTISIPTAKKLGIDKKLDKLYNLLDDCMLHVSGSDMRKMIVKEEL